MSGKRIIHAPRGSERSCKGWHQEAAMRMLMNNLDPDVAEAPDQLVVYGGTGRAARSWEAFDAIIQSLHNLENNETLLVQSGKPVGKFRTHEEAPRVLIANSNLVGQWSNYTEFNRLEKMGLTMYGQMTAGSWMYIGSQGIVQGTFATFAAAACKGYVTHGISLEVPPALRVKSPEEYIDRAMHSTAVHVEAMLALQKKGAITFDYGNNIRAQAQKAGIKNAFDIPGFVPEYIRPLFCEGRGPFRWIALSGDPADI